MNSSIHSSIGTPFHVGTAPGWGRPTTAKCKAAKLPQATIPQKSQVAKELRWPGRNSPQLLQNSLAHRLLEHDHYPLCFLLENYAESRFVGNLPPLHGIFSKRALGANLEL